MSRDEMYNALCAVFFAEEVRLLNKVTELEELLHRRKLDDEIMLELIRARARLKYFRKYILEVLEYLRYFDR
ncbi:MAG: hypothetical protein UHD05_08870 [Ruminococcus sp.]|nr:hypothetical protein [Ruminococcus sp.]